MSYRPVEFIARCVCGATLEVDWEEQSTVQKMDWDEVKATRCLVVKPCSNCQRKLLPPAPPYARDGYY
jgi:hypothetical protein